MTSMDALSRVGQIQTEIASLRTAFTPPAPRTSAPAGAPTSTGSGSGATSFANTLVQARGAVTAAAAADAGAGAATASAGRGIPFTTPTLGTSTPLSATAQSMLTSDQQQFAARLAADTGLNTSVVAAWLLAEESSGAAQSRQAQNNNDWLNIGYTDSGTYGSSDSVWGNPVTAADATAGWLKGQNTIPGYGTASAGIQAILGTVGQSPQAQVAALQQSGWASSGYPSLPALLAQVG